MLPAAATAAAVGTGASAGCHQESCVERVIRSRTMAAARECIVALSLLIGHCSCSSPPLSLSLSLSLSTHKSCSCIDATGNWQLACPLWLCLPVGFAFPFQFFLFSVVFCVIFFLCCFPAYIELCCAQTNMKFALFIPASSRHRVAQWTRVASACLAARLFKFLQYPEIFYIVALSA